MARKDRETDLQPTLDLGTEAYRRINQAILDGVLQPGVRITETELSDRLEMSRTPIREAIYRLEADGLLSHEPRRGLIVTQPDHQMIMEFFAMREVLEGTAARFAAQHASEMEIETLMGLVSDGSVDLADTVALRENNRKFHYLIAHSARNRFLLRSLGVMTVTLSLLPTLPGLDERSATVHEHVAIAQAISERNPQAAERAARDHVRSACRSRVRYQILEG